MSRSAFRFMTLTAILVILNVTGLFGIYHFLSKRPKATVWLTYSYLSPDNENPDRLRLGFDRNLVTADLIGLIEQRELFKFAPVWPGKWIWRDRNALEYVFDKPLPPGRTFTAMATEQFKACTGMVLEADPIEVQTIALQLLNLRTIEANPSYVTIELEFNQPVEPGDLLRHIEFRDLGPENNRLRNIQCLTKAANSEIVLQIPRPASNHLSIQLHKNLSGPGADLPLGQNMVREMAFPPGFCFLNASTKISQYDDSGTISLRFSEPLSRKQELPAISVTPKVEELNIHRSGNNVVLSGHFLAGHRYTIAVPGILLAQDDQTLGDDVSTMVDMPERRPGVSFSHSRGILSPFGNRTLDMKAVNVPALEFSAWRVHNNNLVEYLHNGYYPNTSRLLPKKTVKLDTPRDKITDLAIELKDLIQPGPGIYSIHARGINYHWASDYILVAVTDLAITAKHEKDGYLVWVSSIRHGRGVEGVQVEGITFNNQTLTTEITDKNGIARLSYADDGPDGGLYIITAQKGDDTSYLKPDENQWMIDDVEQSGRPYPQDLEAIMYTERGVYRPGDTIHLTGILRHSTGQIPPLFPVRVKVTQPDGRIVNDPIVQRKEKQQGFFYLDFPTREESQTGRYIFETTLPGSQQVIGSTYAYVETFLPQRIKVKATATADRYDPNQLPTIEVAAEYLWDEPANGLPAKVESRLYPIRFQCKSYRDFTFGTPITTGSILLPVAADKLDEQGKTLLKMKIQDHVKAGFYRMNYTVTVTEPGSRSVSDNGSVFVDRMGHHIGLKLSDGTLVIPGEPFQAEWISLNTNEMEIPPSTLSVKLFTIQYETTLQEVNGRHVWRSIEQLEQVHSETVVPEKASHGSIQLTCKDAGRYRLLISCPETDSQTQLDLYASAHGVDQSLAMNQPDRLEIITDKEIYEPGKMAKVLVRSPLSGTLFLALETDHVVHYQVTDLQNNTAEIEVPLLETLRGGAYLTATVVRSVDPKDKQWLPHRAMGMKRIRFDHGASMMPVIITAPKKARPKETISLTIQTDPPQDPNHPGLIHLWAVDEGILLPTAYETPDPFEFFLNPRRPGVWTADLFFRLLPDYERPENFTRIGAGDPRHTIGALRRNPVQVRREEPDVVWQQAIQVDPGGRTQIAMTLPELIGQMRIMAVAADHDRYGTMHQPVILTKEMFIEAGCPRFAAPGDTFELPAKIFNTTDKAIQTHLKATSNEFIQILNNDTAVTVPANGSVTHTLNINARTIGPAEIKINVAQTDPVDSPLVAESKSSLPIRPATALHTEVKLLTLTAGEKTTIESSQAFIEGTEQLTLTISGRPSIHLEPALERLIGYPYGCLEQTTSRLFSLVYAPQILAPSRTATIQSMVQAGITRLWAMQTTSGGLGFWPGHTQPSEWGSAYAGWCMLEAAQADHNIDSRFRDDLLAYLDSRLNTTDKDMSINTRALLCHVLSGFDRPRLGWMNRLAEQVERLDLAGRAHLAAAFHAAGQTDMARTLLPTQLMDMTIPTTTSNRLTSHLQQHAVWLAVLLEIEPDHPMVGPLANQVMDARSNGAWASTLENAAALMALIRYQAFSQQNPPDFTGTVQLPDGKSLSFTHENPLTTKVNLQTKPIHISSSGQGTIYLALSSEGLAKKEFLQPYSRRLTVERRWMDRTGTSIDPNNLHVGDLIQVKIFVTTTDKSNVGNIVVVDALPGGMEVENPRLITSAQDGNFSGHHPEHIEFLDDRVVLFCTATRHTQIFNYALRVVTAGRFDVPPIQASCMYDPVVAAMGPVGRIVVKP
ncbi:MAG: hypothetical protein JXA82_06275 [Sedimentisphaerales bacterium]|nr:hypothetical protein [Sedimentisphaerales bacterium]